jgi:hypothetical protein
MKTISFYFSENKDGGNFRCSARCLTHEVGQCIQACLDLNEAKGRIINTIEISES